MINPKIVLLGGGTGSFTLLRGLKKLTPNITAIVNMSDDGGSTGSLRDEYGVLPPGDIRQCLVALSDTPEVRDLFSYRFNQGAMSGHTVGNLILSALEMQYGSFNKAVEVAGNILHITGQVIPVTLDKHILVAQDGDKIYRGEHVVDGALALSANTILHLEPVAQLNPAAREAIMAADMVVIAPGSLYSSLVPILAVSGMAETLASTKAAVVSIANLVNKPLQTDDWHAVDYIKQFERYIGPGVIDTVLYNTEPITPVLLKRYAAEGEFPVHVEPIRFRETKAKPVGARLVSKDVSTSSSDGKLDRTLIRHDADAVCEQLQKLLG
jgi:uncharacterized cofD-like protein